MSILQLPIDSSSLSHQQLCFFPHAPHFSTHNPNGPYHHQFSCLLSAYKQSQLLPHPFFHNIILTQNHISSQFHFLFLPSPLQFYLLSSSHQTLYDLSMNHVMMLMVRKMIVVFWWLIIPIFIFISLSHPFCSMVNVILMDKYIWLWLTQLRGCMNDSVQVIYLPCTISPTLHHRDCCTEHLHD